MGEVNGFMNEINWLVSLLVAVPLSIAANLLTPLFQNWRASTSKRAAKARLQVIEKELADVTLFYTEPSRLNTYLLASMMAMIVLFAIPTVLGGFIAVLYALPMSIESSVLARAIAAATGMLSALFNLMAILRANQAMTIYRRVRDYPQFEAVTKALIERLRDRST